MTKKCCGISQTEDITNMKVVVICKTTPQCSGMHVRPEHVMTLNIFLVKKMGGSLSYNSCIFI